MSTCIPLLIELTEDVVLSETAATVGAHRSLDYIAGAALLGAAAARGYGDAATGFNRFHSGGVRFLDGYPAVRTDGRWLRALPMPLAAHRYKDAPASDKLADLLNLSVAVPEAGRQVIQARDGYVLPSLPPLIEPDRRYGMKTAISGATGRPQDAQLFGYDAIGAGQHFIAAVEADDAAEAEAAAELLLGTIRLGRSRSAEFGEATISKLSGSLELPAQPRSEDGLLRLWALSELCLHDTDGNAVLDPAEADLGIGPFTVEWTRTFVRSRVVWPFNGHWRSRGLARPVIAKGSVIAMRLHDERQRPNGGTGSIGLYRESGLGQVAFDPALLGKQTLASFAMPGLAAPEPAAAPPPSPSRSSSPSYADRLGAWLDRQQDDREQLSEVEEHVAAALTELEAHYAAAQRYQGRRGAELQAPTSAQWHAVAVAAKAAATAGTLRDALLEKKSPIASEEDRLWSGAFGRSEPEHFRAWLNATIDRAGGDAPRVIALVARAAADRVDAWTASGKPSAKERGPRS